MNNNKLRLLSGKKIKSPSGNHTRPTAARVRESLLNILGNKLEDCSWLELFSGTGVMSCEVIEKGAKRVYAIESNRVSAKICRENINTINSHLFKSIEASVFQIDALKWLNLYSTRLKNNFQMFVPFDFIFLDPPYKSNLYLPTLKHLLSSKLMNPNTLVICEYAVEMKLEAPSPWREQDRRQYGRTGLLMLSPPKPHPFCTDSMQPRTDLVT